MQQTSTLLWKNRIARRMAHLLSLPDEFSASFTHGTTLFTILNEPFTNQK
jgi:hypothetical protein